MSEPVIPLERLKMHLRVDGEFEDAYLGELVKTAVDYCEMYTGRILAKRAMQLRLDGFPSSELHLSVAPVDVVQAIRYVNTEGELVTLTEDRYKAILDVDPPVIVSMGPWPSDVYNTSGSIVIEVVAGMDKIPNSIEQAMLLLCGHWYENREAMRDRYSNVNEMPFAVTALLHPHRVWRW